MVAEVFFTIRAERELMNILGYIAQDDETTAFDLVVDLKRRVSETLGLFPEAGAKAQAGRRSFTIRRYVFVYRHDAAKGEILVLDVFGPGMNWR